MKYIFTILVTLVSAWGSAQKADRDFSEGNSKYKKKQYADAEAHYRISQSRTPGNAAASYNLGNTVYEQKQPAESISIFAKAAKNATSRPEKHMAFHNLGNALMKNKDYGAAVEAYKNALINDPSDEESRYNFALAKKMLKENPPKQDNKKDQKDDKKDKDKKDEQQKDKDKKDDQKNDQKKDDKGQNPDKNKEQENRQQPKPKHGDMSRQRLENLLDAVNNEEKKVREKVDANKQKARPVRTEKDW